MELRDLIVTPLVIMLVYAIAYMVRPYVTDDVTRRYYFPALTLKIFGALAVGFIYQFYYNGGDTFNFHTHGSRVVWEAIVNNPVEGMRLILSPREVPPSLYEYTSRIWYYGDASSYTVVQVASIFDLITFSSYSATAVLFAVLSMVGSWLMFLTFYKIAPNLHRWIAWSCLFIPTVFFWGSGIFKDTITLAALGVSVYFLSQIVVQRRVSIQSVIWLLLSVWIIFSIKKYVLLCFLPAALIWGFSQIIYRLKSVALKALVIPISTIPVLLAIYYTISKVGEDDPRYSINSLAQTAQITAYDIRYGWGARTGEGSGYSLGELDGTWQSMVQLAPAAINVSLFRPYVWEVKNPLMAISALESMAFLLITVMAFYKTGISGLKNIFKPEIMFCLGFALVFAFAVGVSTFNFGTLSRYKIPMLPFYMLGLGFLTYYAKNRDTSSTISKEAIPTIQNN